jgi:hypothetical protein
LPQLLLILWCCWDYCLPNHNKKAAPAKAGTALLK